MTTERQRADGATEWTFDTITARDAFIEERFPRRTCSDVPGVYILPNGDELGVSLEDVILYPRKEAPMR